MQLKSRFAISYTRQDHQKLSSLLISCAGIVCAMDAESSKCSLQVRL